MARAQKSETSGRRAPRAGRRVEPKPARAKVEEPAPAAARPARRGRAPGVASLFGLPLHGDAHVAPNADVLISGVPFDAASGFRPGARFGPRAVREASAQARPFSSALGVDLFDEISAADGGDLASRSGDPADVVEAVAERTSLAVGAGVIPGFVGGDRSVTLGALRGLRRTKHRASGLLLLSAHPGLSGGDSDQILAKNVIRHALGEGLIRTDSSLQVGVRGPLATAEEIAFGFSSGIETASIDEVRWDLHAVVSQVRRLVMKGAIYVSIDLAVLDPAFAPGVSTPSPGGMSTWELQQILRALVGAELLGFDVLELCPAYDPAGITALAGVGVIHEILAALADTRRSARPAPSTRRTGRAGRRSA